jgi:anti-sigma regulatory factor (Ser/Thr protein kinase)
MLQQTLAPDPRSAAEARRFAADVLIAWDEESLADTVQLLVSELVTNAVLHAGSPVRLALWRRDNRIHVDVVDDSAVPPGLRDYDAEATTGRGLDLVGMVADAWGVEPRAPQGKSVWFEVLASNPDAPAVGDAAPPTIESSPPPTPTESVTVRLIAAPVRLLPAMQQHTDSLLREYALIGLETNGGTPPPRLEIDLNPIAEQLATAIACGNATTELVL